MSLDAPPLPPLPASFAALKAQSRARQREIDRLHYEALNSSLGRNVDALFAAMRRSLPPEMLRVAIIDRQELFTGDTAEAWIYFEFAGHRRIATRFERHASNAWVPAYRGAVGLNWHVGEGGNEVLTNDLGRALVLAEIPVTTVELPQ